MKFKERILTFTENMRGGIIRFFSSFIISVILYLLLSYDIIASPARDFLEKCYPALGMGLAFSVFFVILSEKFGFYKKASHLFCIIPTVICYFFADMSNDYFQMVFWGIILALICFTLCLLFTKENSPVLIPHIVKSSVFTVLVCGILSIGISLCLVAFQTLIYDFSYEVYAVANLFIWIVVFSSLFLAYLPEKDEEITLPKLFKTIVVNVALPVYILLMAILLIYLIKIVITMNMPVGQINWFASFASLFFVFFTFTVRQYDSKLPKIFTRFIGFFIVPVVIMQLIAIYERVAAYGLTTPRIVSLILVGVAIIFAVFSMIRKKSDYVFGFVGIIILVFTLVPKINIIDLPKQSQINILQSYLTKNNMLSDGKITANADIPTEDKERIVSAYNYLKYNAAGTLPDWLENIGDKSTADVLGFSGIEYGSDLVHCSYSSADYADISEYSGMYDFNNYKSDYDEMSITFNINGSDYSYDALSFFTKLYNNYGEDNNELPPIPLDENTSVYIRSSWATLPNDMSRITQFHIGGYILIK